MQDDANPPSTKARGKESGSRGGSGDSRVGFTEHGAIPGMNNTSRIIHQKLWVTRSFLNSSFAGRVMPLRVQLRVEVDGDMLPGEDQ